MIVNSNSLAGIQKYEIQIRYINGNYYEEVPISHVAYIIIDDDYDNKNMPTIYLSLNLSYTLYDKLVKNIKTGRLYINAKKFNVNSISSTKRVVLNHTFRYMIPTEQAGYDSIINTDNQTIAYRQGTLALMKVETLEDNYCINNGIIYNSNIISVVHHYTKHMPMVIEPFENNDIVDRVIIPPMNTVTKLLNYLNSIKPFYNSGYRYFRDLDKTYLLADNSSIVKLKETPINTMIINIHELLLDEADYSGMSVDTNSGNYFLNIDMKSTNINIDRYITDTSYIGVSSTGEMIKCGTDDDTSLLYRNTEKVNIYRVFNDNLDYMKQVKTFSDSNKVLIAITKVGIDSSVITPNMEFVIKNYTTYKDYDGRYILISKKEALMQTNGEFVTSTTLLFRKAMDDE